MILHRHMPRERGDIGHDHMTAERDIVREMAVGENVIVRAHQGYLAITGGAVDRDVFAEGVGIANFRASNAALPFQILRLETEAGKWKYFILHAELRVTVNDHMRMKLAAVAEHDVFARRHNKARFHTRNRSARGDG